MHWFHDAVQGAIYGILGSADAWGAETSMTMTDGRTKSLIDFTWCKEGSKFFIHTYSQRAPRSSSVPNARLWSNFATANRISSLVTVLQRQPFRGAPPDLRYFYQNHLPASSRTLVQPSATL